MIKAEFKGFRYKLGDRFALFEFKGVSALFPANKVLYKRLK